MGAVFICTRLSSKVAAYQHIEELLGIYKGE